MSSAAVFAARGKLLRAALRVLAAEHSDPHAHSDAEAEYADELLALAARDLSEATEASDRKPVGWERTNPADLAGGDWVTVIFRNARLFSAVEPDFHNDGKLTVEVGHDAYGPILPVVLTDDVTVILTGSSERAPKAEAPAAKGADQ